MNSITQVFVLFPLRSILLKIRRGSKCVWTLSFPGQWWMGITQAIEVPWKKMQICLVKYVGLL